MPDSDIRLIRSAAPFGTISAADNTATTGKFIGFYTNADTVISAILDKDGTSIISEIIKGGAGTLLAGGYHTCRSSAGYISSITHDGTGEITLVYANAEY
jgi:hypothetical protein